MPRARATRSRTVTNKRTGSAHHRGNCAPCVGHRPLSKNARAAASAPFELADAVLAETCATRRRLRLLPGRVGVYFVLALGLFGQVSYAGSWGRLVAALTGLPGPGRDVPVAEGAVGPASQSHRRSDLAHAKYVPGDNSVAAFSSKRDRDQSMRGGR